MADAAIFYSNSISEVGCYALYAEARLGSNGDPWGAPELVVGTSPDDAQYSRVTWDADLQDGFDSGEFSGVLETSVDAINEELAATAEMNQEPITFSTSFSGNIEKVQVRALTLAAAAVSWSEIRIEFYRNGVLADAYTNLAGISVDERSATGPVEAQAMLEVVPEAGEYDQVIISGSYRMVYDSTAISPGETDLAGQFFVFCA